MEWSKGKIIGRGSSATVYAATCLKSGEMIAVKSAELSRSSFLQREAKILSSLNSPYIIGYRGCEITKTPSSKGEATYNLLMEYAPYGTLTDLPVKLDETQVVEYTRQILKGLEYIHSKEIAHCDIKGTNVVISETGEAKIADFGCSKLIKPEITGPVKGTPAFMAPEVARGEKQGKESDIWALGCTVIEMFTGSIPWIRADSNSDSTDPVSVLYRVGYLGESPELPCWLTEQAKDFLGKCLKREVKERWSATELLNHRFLSKPDIEPGLVIEPVLRSPTSVMDERLWRSVEDEEERIQEERIQEERIRVLSWSGPTWEEMEGGDWITVRWKHNH